MKSVAIVLAAGQGKRMGMYCPKQYLLLNGKPVIYYSLKAFEESDIDEIILVVGEGEKEYCEQEIINRYQFKKVMQIVSGGSERYHSVYNGLQVVQNAEYVFIHDGARPFLSKQLIEDLFETVRETKACIAGMPVKDTIKLINQKKQVEKSLDRSKVWQIQTPQVFEYQLVKQAYDKLFEQKISDVTDDAMVVERMTGHAVTLVKASYKNIKITTPEDLEIGECFLANEKTKNDKFEELKRR